MGVCRVWKIVFIVYMIGLVCTSIIIHDSSVYSVPGLSMMITLMLGLLMDTVLLWNHRIGYLGFKSFNEFIQHHHKIWL